MPYLKKILSSFLILPPLLSGPFCSSIHNERRLDRGINLLEKITINGDTQWLSIRGADTKNPILLFLHSGPGTANLSLIRNRIPDIENHFIVVNWDQRCAGKSYSIFGDPGKLSMTQMIEDARSVVSHIKARFGVKRIFLMGFSWGSALGLTLAGMYPDDYYAYISIGQMVRPIEGEKISCCFVARKASEAGDNETADKIMKMDCTYSGAGFYSALMKQRGLLVEYGGVYHRARSYTHEAKMLFMADEYSLIDFLFWPLGNKRSVQHLWPEVMKLDFFQSVSNIKVPVFFFAGRHDYNTPAELIERYYTCLRAEKGKKLVWFEESSHCIFFDEPDKLSKAIIEVKKNILERKN
ncbi:MAG: alpha/beta hydrolase [Spirochaetes bacterium]|jgi:pimeloyl-ACP methyl ester carboxylesterase|nr:alpha/beta hydrolase [Spirochaetota bacterium]